MYSVFVKDLTKNQTVAQIEKLLFSNFNKNEILIKKSAYSGLQTAKRANQDFSTLFCGTKFEEFFPNQDFLCYWKNIEP